MNAAVRDDKEGRDHHVRANIRRRHEQHEAAALLLYVQRWRIRQPRLREVLRLRGDPP